MQSGGNKHPQLGHPRWPSAPWLAGFAKLKYDLVLSHEPELIAGDALYGERVVLELLHFHAQRADVTTELHVLGVDALELLLKRLHSR